MLAFRSHNPVPAVLALLVLAFLLAPSPAAAAGFGIRGGASISPDQFVFGGHVDLLAKRGLLRPVLPIVEIGLGDNLTGVSVLADLLVRPKLHLAEWELFGGLEGGLRYNNFDGGGDDTDLVWMIVLATERKRLGGQVKINLSNAPDVEFLATYSFGGGE
jgi:hypothetical protein